MGVYCYVELTSEEDNKLREIEQSRHLNCKVRLRAQMLRLSHQGWTMQQIARYVQCSVKTVERTFKRWGEGKFETLADAPQLGNRRVLRQEMLTFLQQKLTEERSWHATQLVEAVQEQFATKVDRETIRRNVRALGYSWKRDRYVVAGRGSRTA